MAESFPCPACASAAPLPPQGWCMNLGCSGLLGEETTPRRLHPALKHSSRRLRMSHHKLRPRHTRDLHSLSLACVRTCVHEGTPA